ncbi:DgyrCDS3911 [Dimorphilus gyrociliatus]|uniref:DgyrCDS3911 n=1 Tax=Dimorphilus gyrociliatus TaxID=2664684 RepID=A0A7I8VFB1_9ANNE|nr:DgyrCDS3911 [Dimorphilus gyrociliatus]
MSSVRIRRDENSSDLPPHIEKELEKRKNDWQHEVERLQQEFFKMPLPKSNEQSYRPTFQTNTNQPEAIQALPGEDDERHKDLLRKVLARDQDDFVVEFDLSEFDQESVKISLSDKSRNLIVSAKKEAKEGDTTTTRNFRKEVHVPFNIDLNTLQSKLVDGNLRISGRKEQKEPPPSYEEFDIEPYTSNNMQLDTIDSVLQNPYYDSSFEVAKPEMTLSSQSNKLKAIESNPDKITKLEVNIGITYKAENVTIKVTPDKISIVAEKEEKIGSQTSKRQFVRNFQMTDKINVWSVEAVSSDGVVTICACAADADLEEVRRELRRNLPISGKRCRVIQES